MGEVTCPLVLDAGADAPSPWCLRTELRCCAPWPSSVSRLPGGPALPAGRRPRGPRSHARSRRGPRRPRARPWIAKAPARGTYGRGQPPALAARGFQAVEPAREPVAEPVLPVWRGRWPRWGRLQDRLRTRGRACRPASPCPPPGIGAPLGQASTQAPQPVHRSTSMVLTSTHLLVLMPARPSSPLYPAPLRRSRIWSHTSRSAPARAPWGW
jgi:hypothetical protein